MNARTLLVILGAVLLASIPGSKAESASAFNSRSEESETSGLRVAQESNAVVENQDQQLTSNRRLFSFWSLLFMFAGHCPPIGPAHDKCVSSNGGDDDDDDGGDGNEDGGDDWSRSSGVDGGSATSKTGATGTVSRSMSLLAYIVAGVAATIAVAAVIVGQRRNPEDRHLLAGSVARRMTLFSALADNACGGTQRPERVVSSDYEMA